MLARVERQGSAVDLAARGVAQRQGDQAVLRVGVGQCDPGAGPGLVDEDPPGEERLDRADSGLADEDPG